MMQFGTAPPPELPRVLLDTRMPPDPARGGRVIQVGRPARSATPKRASAETLLGALALAAFVTALWRHLRRRGAKRGVN